MVIRANLGARMEIDDEAKSRVPLTRLEDEHGNDYFIGKLQSSITLDFDEGISFMIFTSEKGAEELHIGVVEDPQKIRKARKSGMHVSNRITIDMHSCLDSDQQTFYVGEAICPAFIKCRNPGIFFTFFCSKKGKEELQISRLAHNRKKRRPNNE